MLIPFWALGPGTHGARNLPEDSSTQEDASTDASQDEDETDAAEDTKCHALLRYNRTMHEPEST